MNPVIKSVTEPVAEPVADAEQGEQTVPRQKAPRKRAPKKAAHEKAAHEKAAHEKAAHEPKIVGFLCNWCSYAGADKAGAAQITYPPNVRAVRVMCSGRVDPQFVLAAFSEGADGVLVLACHPGDCHYKEQNYRAVARHQLMSRLLADRGIDPRRYRFGFVSAAEGQEFADTVADMTQQLRELGPLPGARIERAPKPKVPTRTHEG